jgi:ABC-type branched-subunit amino acid transport system ATPase component
MWAIARALMSRPKLLLLDEPSLGLAPQIVREIFAVIRQQHDTGVTVLLVEQNPMSLSIEDLVLSPWGTTICTPKPS